MSSPNNNNNNVTPIITITKEDDDKQFPGGETVTIYTSASDSSHSQDDSETSFEVVFNDNNTLVESTKDDHCDDISTKADCSVNEELNLSDIQITICDDDDEDSSRTGDNSNNEDDLENVPLNDYPMIKNQNNNNNNNHHHTHKLKPNKAILTICGLYGRAPKPGIENLPTNYTENDMKPNQFMSRRRLHTKPLSVDEFGNLRNDTDDGCDTSSSSSSTTNNEKQSYDNAMFVPVRGLIDGDNSFWHIDYYNKEGLYEDRAVLFQAKEHYETIQTKSHFDSNTICVDYMENPYFGEQVIVEGLDSSKLCVGDIFKVANGLSTLVVEITSPRKPCYHVDKRNGTQLGSKGMKRYTLNTGLAGWFTRVLVAGELREGMKLIRTSHPHPKWNLEYLCKVLYNEGSPMAIKACKAQWVREKEELMQLMNIPQLGEYEWKEDGRKLLMKMEEKEKLEAAKKRSMLSFLWSKQNTSPELKITIKGIYGHPEEYDETKIMDRDRYTKDGYQPVLFSPTRGIANETFWHVDEDKINGGKLHSDRAILFQSIEHYELLKKDPLFTSCFDDTKENDENSSTTSAEEPNYMSSPTFGEQVIVQGCDASSIAVGDVFEVEGGESKLVFEISAPRKAGDTIDLKHHGRLMGQNGIKDHCLKHGFAGWFTRVLIGGELSDDMVLVRTKHPNPKWTMAYISSMMYSDGDIPKWGGTREELIEMINLPQLGDVHWKQEGKKLLRRYKKNVEFDTETTEGNRNSFFSRILNLATGATFCYCDGMDNLVSCVTGSNLDSW